MHTRAKKQPAGGLFGIGKLMEFHPLVYGYSNARVRAMRPQLLSKRQAEDLLRVKTSAAVIEYLSRTAYKNDFSGLPPKITDEERIELAVSRNFARTAQKLLRITPAKDKALLAAFLNRYDVHNLKSILLSKKLGRTKEEAQSLLVPAGSMTMQELSSLQNAKGADDFFAILRGTLFGGKFLTSASIRHIPRDQVKSLFHNPSDSTKLDLFIAALDFYYYEMASSMVDNGGAGTDARAISHLLRSEADAKNIITILRLKRSGADKKTIMEHMVGGGGLSRASLEKICSAKDLHESLGLASSFFMSQTGRDEFSSAEQRYKADSQLSHFEVVFERSMARRSLHALKRSTMSIGAIIGFFFLKEEEMSNIQKIARGKSLGLAPEKIAEMLVLVS
jgi:V/A-type H+-transporting ATPase subunit C